MEMEDKESTESGSPSGNSESESPAPVASAGDRASSGGGGVVAPQVMNMSMDRSVGVINNASSVTVSGVIASGGVISGGSGTGGSASELMMGKKKRGRPRKYDSDGNLRVPYVGSPPGGVLPPPRPAGFTLLPTPPSKDSSGTKKGRGRHTGSGNWQILASLGELFATTAGGDFTPHVITVYAGEDVAGKILTFNQKGPRGLCVLSANGSVSNVTIRQPGSSGGLLTYEGRFEILTLTGSFTFSENGGIRSRTGGLSVSLAGPDGRVIGGGIAGMLMAASPIQVVFGSFMPNNYKPHKRKYNVESRVPPLIHSPPATTTLALPVSQPAQVPAPEINASLFSPSQLPLPTPGVADRETGNKEYPFSTPAVTVDWNGPEPISDQRPSPDINVSVTVE